MNKRLSSTQNKKSKAQNPYSMHYPHTYLSSQRKFQFEHSKEIKKDS
jgi:hypothetical protein